MREWRDLRDKVINPRRLTVLTSEGFAPAGDEEFLQDVEGTGEVGLVIVQVVHPD